MSAMPEAALIGGLPPNPRLRGTPSWGIDYDLSAALRQDLASFLPRGHRPLPGQKLGSTCAEMRPPVPAESGQLGSCGGWRKISKEKTRERPDGHSLESYFRLDTRRNEVSQKAFLLTFFSEKSKLALQGLSPGGVLGHLLVALGLGDAVGQDVDLHLGLGAGGTDDQAGAVGHLIA